MDCKKFILPVLTILIFQGCKQEDIAVLSPDGAAIELPKGFPAISYPEDNAHTTERWELGKRLFYDNILSIDSSKNCGSCHKPSLGFSDDAALSIGVKNRLGTRNTPTLANVAYHPYFTREGGVPSLEQQILVPIQEHNEFDFNIVLAGERIAHDSTYRKMSQAAYNRDPDYYVITRAIANFERSLISKSSSFDLYAYENQTDALSDAQIRGMELFYSEKTNCSKCHSGPNFTNYAFENNGLYESYSDEGRKRLTGKDSDIGRYKVATLRNIELTGPYMHDGSLKTLVEVIEHYNSGGKEHSNKNSIIRPLDLSPSEKADLLSFLLSLTDIEFLTDNRFRK